MRSESEAGAKSPRSRSAGGRHKVANHRPKGDGGRGSANVFDVAPGNGNLGVNRPGDPRLDSVHYVSKAPIRDVLNLRAWTLLRSVGLLALGKIPCPAASRCSPSVKKQHRNSGAILARLDGAPASCCLGYQFFQYNLLLRLVKNMARQTTVSEILPKSPKKIWDFACSANGRMQSSWPVT